MCLIDKLPVESHTWISSKHSSKRSSGRVVIPHLYSELKNSNTDVGLFITLEVEHSVHFQTCSLTATHF